MFDHRKTFNEINSGQYSSIVHFALQFDDQGKNKRSRLVVCNIKTKQHIMWKILYLGIRMHTMFPDQI